MNEKNDIKKYALMGILVAFKENDITLNEEYRSISASVEENIIQNKINLNFIIKFLLY